MIYQCITEACAISQSKATFPFAMDCPVCKTPLRVQEEEELVLSEVDDNLIKSLPYLIAYPLKQTLIEKHPWTKINLLKDTFLNYLKYLALISASEFFNSSLKDKNMVALFHQNLAETAFGKWNHYIRETLKYLEQNNHKFFCPNLLNYYKSVESGAKTQKYKGEIEFIDGNGDIQLKKQEATAIGILINFRNRFLGHGLTLDSEISEQLWNEYYPIFRTLLEGLNFTREYPMYKKEDGLIYLLQSAKIESIENNVLQQDQVWMQNPEGETFPILPFFITPSEVALGSDNKAKLLTYESYTGKTIKFFSPEGIEKQTSGRILERLNLLLREKQKEIAFTPESFTKDIFLQRIAEENKLLIDTLISEKKIVPGVYQHREEIEIKLREWIGASASIFFIVAEAGSGKTNLLAEIQRQYSERSLPSLLIRAGRMEKNALKEQIAYLLNINLLDGLENYTSIAGSQAQPTFILIDGINEANNSEDIWQEIIQLSKIFAPGSLKFIVTNRANTKADLKRYVINETDIDLLYGENKNNETGLEGYSFWLTALDMNEMKGAWESYVASDKSKFKPLFSFDDLATFDRALYNQINNPLILRLFLEIYNGKPLPKKGNKHLHIWQDWLKNFSQKEQTFLKILAKEFWLKGKNELLLDDLLNNENAKSYFTSDIINAPYTRLKNQGWISSYVKNLNRCIGFTVEGALLYLLGSNLLQLAPSLAEIQSILESGNKLQKSAIESYLCEEALSGNLESVTDLIDAGTDEIDLCINPLLHYLKAFGSKAALEKILENPTENDWKVLLKLDDQLDELQLQVLRKELLIEVMHKNSMSNKDALWLGLKAISVLDKKEALVYMTKIYSKKILTENNSELLYQYGICETKFGNFNKALTFHEKSLAIRIQSLGKEHPNLSILYNAIGEIQYLIGEYDKALEYFEKCLFIELKTSKIKHLLVATLYENIGLIYSKKDKYRKALDYNRKSLAIRLKALGYEHPSVATSYNNIGVISRKIGEPDKALDFYKKSLAIKLKTLGSEHPAVGTTYNNIGLVYNEMGEYNKALEYYDKSLAIKLKTLGSEHPGVGTTYNNIGSVYNEMGEYNKALEYYEKCLAIELKTLGSEHPATGTTYDNIGKVYNKIGEYNKALEYYEKCLAIELKTLGSEHPDTGTTYNNIGMVYNKMGEYNKALEYYEKCLYRKLKSLGEKHPDVARSFNNIGLAWDNKGEHNQALEYYEKSLNIRLKTLGVKHLDIASSYNNIAKCYEKLNQNEKAFSSFIQCALVYKDNFGLKNEYTQKAILDIKRIAKLLGKESEIPEWLND
jgi:tetratricopeptide (TPR) repeat protein